MMVISIILIPLLFSCAATQQKQVESKDTDFYKDRRVTSDAKGQTEVKSKNETLLEDYRVIQRIKIPAKYLLSPGDFFRCLTFSPDGKRLAYIWKGVSIGGGSCSAWIDDNKVSPDFDFIWEGIAFCSNGSNVAYSAPGSSNNMYVWVNNNKISPEFRHTLDVSFSPDCSKVAYRAITHRDYDPNKGWGKNSIWINSTRISPEGYAAYHSGKPVFSPDGSKVAYAVRIGKKSSVWINDKKVSPDFDGEIQPDLIFSPDGTSIAYGVWHEKLSSIWINDKCQFNNAGGLVFSPDGSKVAYYSFEKKSVLIDDKKVSPELGFSHKLVFSPDGSKVAYYVSEGKKSLSGLMIKKYRPIFPLI
jgi:Tol biopolymer transport system component